MQITKAEKVHVEAGDTVVVTCDTVLSGDSRRAVKAGIQEAFPHATVLVLDKGIAFNVFKSAQPKRVLENNYTKAMKSKLTAAFDHCILGTTYTREQAESLCAYAKEKWGHNYMFTEVECGFMVFDSFNKLKGK